MLHTYTEVVISCIGLLGYHNHKTYKGTMYPFLMMDIIKIEFRGSPFSNTTVGKYTDGILIDN